MVMLSFATLTMSVAVAPVATEASAEDIIGNAMLPADANLAMESFLELTPKKYREMTGNKLSLKETIALKIAQRKVKKQQRMAANGGQAADFSKGIYILLAIFGLGWLAMGLLDDFEGNNWWIGLILGFLCFFPGLIYSLIKMKDYY